MPFTSSNLYQQSPSSDQHVLPPPAVYTPTGKSPSSAICSCPRTPPAQPTANTDLQRHNIWMDAAGQAESQEGQLSDLEAGQLDVFLRRSGRDSSACVFCLATRDVCLERGMHDVPTLFNAFGEEAWEIIGSLCSECKLSLRGGPGEDEAGRSCAQQQQIADGWGSIAALPAKPRAVAVAGKTTVRPKSNVIFHWAQPSRLVPGTRHQEVMSPIQEESLVGGFGSGERNGHPATRGSADGGIDQGSCRSLQLAQGINLAATDLAPTSTPQDPPRVKIHRRDRVSWGSVSTLCDTGYQDQDMPHAAAKVSNLGSGGDALLGDGGNGDLSPGFSADVGSHDMDEKKNVPTGSRPYSLTFENINGGRVVSYNGAFNSSRSSRTIIGYNDGRPDSTLGIPEKAYPQPYRGLRHRLFIVYRRLFSLVFLCNIAALIVITQFPQINRDWTGTVSVMNLTVAVLVRQDRVVNLLYAIFCSVPRTWPLWIRRQSAKIYHLGGVHSGAATASVVWFIASVVYSIKRSERTSGSVPTETLVMSWTAIALLLAMLIAAYPALRKRYHNRFELVHRFAGWTALAIFWAQSIYNINNLRDHRTKSLGTACLHSPNFWLLLVVSISIASPWLHLRKVNVRSEILSDHAVRLHFDYVTPVAGSFTRMSERPLIEWHSFAVIPVLEPTAKQEKGYSVIVSNAGDWTRRQIQHPPTKLWIRGLPTCGVMHVASLFNRIVLVGTGSGIGPLLSFLQPRPVPIRVIWSTPDPIRTFGEEICKDVVAADPDCIIHDTKLLGRPDLVRMAYQASVEFEAEAVIIIANEKITKKVVYGLETRGVAAYGAIWDS